MMNKVLNRIKAKIGLKDICILETDEERQLVWDALESAERYKWHDLRKDPKDLPHEKDVVLAFDGAEYGTAVFYNSGIYHGWATSDQDLEPSEITAWKYIEPLEEVEE